MTAALHAQIQRLQAELMQCRKERDQARANFRIAFGIVREVYTHTGVRNFVVNGTVYEFANESPEQTRDNLRRILRAIPMQVQRMHEASPEVPRAQWHATVQATQPMPLQQWPGRYYDETRPAPLYPETQPMGIR